MAIEGPLRELGVHDVFQLLDLTRKTGSLRVRSALRDNDGVVKFVNGRVVGATMRDDSHKLGIMLVQSGRVTQAELERALAIQAQPGETRRVGEVLLSIGAVTARELERQARRQIETVVFELLSWSEGYFTFEEGMPQNVRPEDGGLTAEALLMEAARRIDEWARMADRIPNAEVVPALSAVDDGHAATLDLRPREWQVLAAVDGQTSVRAIASGVGLNEFDAARIVYGLLSTGVVTLVSAPAPPMEEDVLVHLSDAREATRDGRMADAIAAAERAILQTPGIAEAHAVAGLAHFALHRLDDADRYLRQALQLEPRTEWMMSAARLSLRRGDLAGATRYWKGIIAAEPRSRIAAQAREALEQAMRLQEMAGTDKGR
jgi:tetratricopeptide (TPR) repeat protein